MSLFPKKYEPINKGIITCYKCNKVCDNVKEIHSINNKLCSKCYNIMKNRKIFSKSHFVR